MKIIVVIILIAIGVFLFRRAQRLAKEEQEAITPKKTTENSTVYTEHPEQVETTTAVNEVKAVVLPEFEVVTAKEVEAELMPREPQAQTASQTHTLHIAPDVNEADAPAAHNEEAVIILGSPPNEMSDPVETTPKFEPISELAAQSTLNMGSASSTSEISFAAPDTWANITLQRAFEEYQRSGSALERYTALQNMIGECYKQRKSADYLNYGAQLTQPYLALFHAVSAEKDKVSELKTSGFLQLATLLSDTQAFDAAIALCQEALLLGLSDGTVTGFEGRISRIEKAQAKVAKV